MSQQIIKGVEMNTRRKEAAHGTLIKYTRDHCRCQSCRAMMTVYLRVHRRRVRQMKTRKIYCLGVPQCRGHKLTLVQVEQERGAGRPFAVAPGF